MFFGTSALMEFVLKNPCQQLCSLSLAPCQRSYACPIAECLRTAWQGLSAQFFGTIALTDGIFKTMSMLPGRSLPTELSLSYFPPFPVRPPCPRFRLAPSQRSTPQAISLCFLSVHPVVPSVSLLPNGTLPKLFPTVSCPPCPHFRIAPSQRSFPQAISHGFPSVRRRRSVAPPAAK